EGANVAELNGWKSGGEITSQDSKWTVLSNMLQAGGGEPLKIGAKVSARVNAPRTVLATFGELDVAGAVNVPGVRSRRERKNSIIPRYRSEAHDWQIVAAEPITATEYQTEDGGLRQKEVEYPLCQNDVQAGQLAGYDLVNARELFPITLTAKPAWMGYRPGDCININLPEMGLISQKAIILNRDLDLPTGTVSMTLTSETEGKHAFALGQTAIPPATPGLSVPDYSTVIAPAVEAFHASVGYLTSGLNALPAISITGVGDNPFAKYIVIEYRVVGTADWIEWATAPATTTAFTITGLDANQTYEIAISYISVLGVRGARRIYGPFITGGVNANQLGGIDGATIINGLNTNIEGLAKEILSRQNLDAFTKATFYDGNGKSIKTIAISAIDKADNAVSTMNLIGAMDGTHSAFVLNGATVGIYDGDGTLKTLSQYVNAVSTKVGDLETTVAIQQESLNGITGKLTMSVTAPGGTGGIVIGAGPEGSYIGFAAGELAIFDNSDTSVYTKPFSYASGVITLNALVKINGAAMINGSLSINAVPINFALVPAYAKTAMNYHGDGATIYTLCETTVELEVSGYLECTAVVYQGFPSGNDDWEIWLEVDGVADEPTSYIQGAWTQVAVPMMTTKYKPAGIYTITLKWRGGSTVENVVGVMFPKGMQKTS
ncbi:MAG TPA: phage tail protein, partial [Asticcacaulis sp.]|nr:phage tail protein [Asticcacaulis sp.]